MAAATCENVHNSNEHLEFVTQPVRDANVEQVTIDASTHVHGNSNVKATCVATGPITNLGNKTSIFSTNQVPITYATKLSPSVNVDKDNFRKYEASA